MQKKIAGLSTSIVSIMRGLAYYAPSPHPSVFFSSRALVDDGFIVHRRTIKVTPYLVPGIYTFYIECTTTQTASILLYYIFETKVAAPGRGWLSRRK